MSAPRRWPSGLIANSMLDGLDATDRFAFPNVRSHPSRYSSVPPGITVTVSRYFSVFTPFGCAGVGALMFVQRRLRRRIGWLMGRQPHGRRPPALFAHAPLYGGFLQVTGPARSYRSCPPQYNAWMYCQGKSARVGRVVGGDLRSKLHPRWGRCGRGEVAPRAPRARTRLRNGSNYLIDTSLRNGSNYLIDTSLRSGSNATSRRH